MLISSALLAHLGACVESQTHYLPDLQQGSLRYWDAYTQMLKNPPGNAGDVAAWTQWMDGLQSRAEAIKFEGRFRFASIWKLVANGSETLHASLASAVDQRTKDITQLLGDLHSRYRTVAFASGVNDARYTPLAEAAHDEQTLFEMTDESGGKHRVTGWTATQDQVSLLAGAFIASDQSLFVIYQKIIDTDDGFTAWDVVSL